MWLHVSFFWLDTAGNNVQLLPWLALQGRNGKRKRFAGTGMGKPHNIRPSDGRGNGLFLDGGRGVEAENLDGLQNFR